MSTTVSTTRTVEGLAFPEPGRYVIDPNHTVIEAVARHLMVSKVRGRFSDFAGEIVVGDTPQASSASVTIQAASIDTSAPDRDAHLRSPDFLDADTYPELTFRSTAVRAERGSWKVDGDLTIRGVTRPVTLDVEYHGTLVDPFSRTVAAFAATAEIERGDWGMTWNQALEAGGVLVGPTLKIALEVEAVQQA